MRRTQPFQCAALRRQRQQRRVDVDVMRARAVPFTAGTRCAAQCVSCWCVRRGAAELRAFLPQPAAADAEAPACSSRMPPPGDTQRRGMVRRHAART